MFLGRKRSGSSFFIFRENNKERMNRMRKKKNLWSGVSILIVAVLVITAFIRGNAQAWLLAAAFVIWAVWATYYFLVPYRRSFTNGRQSASAKNAKSRMRPSTDSLSPKCPTLWSRYCFAMPIIAFQPICNRYTPTQPGSGVRNSRNGS